MLMLIKAIIIKKCGKTKQVQDTKDTQKYSMTALQISGEIN